LTYADGVHLGQQDLPIAEARRLLSDDMIIGISTANPKEARDAQAADADYVAVGAIYPSTSKGNTRHAGLATLRQVHQLVDTIPVVAIGGINESNVAEVRSAGADAVAVISAVAGAADVRSAANRLAAAFAS
jgi:thiamine-phosphate pyrophosphorylase